LVPENFIVIAKVLFVISIRMRSERCLVDTLLLSNSDMLISSEKTSSSVVFVLSDVRCGTGTGSNNLVVIDVGINVGVGVGVSEFEGTGLSNCRVIVGVADDASTRVSEFDKERRGGIVNDGSGCTGGAADCDVIVV
jgi:hypothetical protein